MRCQKARSTGRADPCFEGLRAHTITTSTGARCCGYRLALLASPCQASLLWLWSHAAPCSGLAAR